MIQTIRKVFAAKMIFAMFLIYSVWWIYAQSTPFESNIRNLFSDTYTIVAFWGGISGLLIAKKWGGFKSMFGRAINMFSIGLLLETIGQLIGSYYFYVLNVDIAYPSIADLGYFGAIICYIYGAYLLAKICGVQFQMKSLKSKMMSAIFLLLFLLVPYFTFLSGYNLEEEMLVNPIKVFLDFATPLGQSTFLLIAFLTYLFSREMLGGIMKNKILWILVGLSFQYIADFVFIYKDMTDTWQAGGQSEYLFLFAYTVISLAIIQLDTALKELQINKQ